METSIHDVVKHIQKVLPTYNNNSIYPYDLEDAMLLWMNQVVDFARKQPHLASRVEGGIPKCDLEDLGKDLDNGWVLCILLMTYFPQLDSKRLSQF